MIIAITPRTPAKGKPAARSWCKRLWLLKNSICLKTDPKGVTRNVSEIGENRFIGHPDATHFRQKFCERVFQQLRLIATVTFGLPVIWVYSVLRV